MATGFLQASIDAQKSTLSNPNSSPLQLANAQYDLGQHQAQQLSQQMNQGGQVLGASTTGQANSGGAADASTQNYDSLLNSANQGINAQYQPILDNLDKQVGLAANDKQSLLDQVNNMFGTNQASIASAQQGSVDQLNQSKTDVGTRQAQTLRDLEQNLTNQYQAANRQLGAVGAGDSSATGQYQYALAKLGTQQRSQILQNANNLYSQINLKMADVQRTASDQLNQLQGWKNDNLLKIQNDYQKQLADIDTQKAGANAQRQADLNNIALQIKSNAITRLQQVQDQAASSANALQQWAQTHSTDLQGALGSLQNGLSTNPNAISQAGSFNAGSGALGNTSLTLNGLQQGLDTGGLQFPGLASQKKDQNGLF